jgi:hypothetical protein
MLQRMWGKGHTVGGNIKEYSIMDNGMVGPQKTKSSSTIWSSNPTLWYRSKENKTCIPKT